MKLKINIEKYSNYSSDSDKEVITKEIEFDDKMFDEITRPLKTKNKVKKCLWYATFDDKLLLNYKGKHTYTSEKKLYNGIIANFEQLFKYYKIDDYKYEPLTYIQYDFKELLDRLLKENRIKFHSIVLESIE